MKKILLAILILLMFKAQGQIAQAPIIFSTVAQMTASQTSYQQAWVNDTLQGGLFKSYLGATLYVDSGVVFQGVGRQWVRMVTPTQALNANWWGVTGDSTLDQTQKMINCIDYAVLARNSATLNLKGNLGLAHIDLPAGVITVTRSILNFDSSLTDVARGLWMSGNGNQSTRFKIDNDTSYLFDVNGFVHYLKLENFQMDGGAGLYRQRAKFITGSGSPGFQKIFTYLELANYSVCAIASNLSNDPFYDISHCKFNGGVNAMAIMLPPGGGDNVYINWQTGGRTFLAMRDPNDTRVYNNRIGGTNLQNEHGGRQIFWVVADPDTALNQHYSQGVEIYNNFLGNEASNPYDVPIFLSYADTSSNPDHVTNPNWGSYQPSFKLVTDVGTIIRGVSIYNNSFNVDSGHARGIIYSEIERVQFTYYNNYMHGDFPYLFQMDSTLTNFSVNNNWVQNCFIDMSRNDFTGGMQPNIMGCNLPGLGLMFDPQHTLKASIPSLEFPSASAYQYQSISLDTFKVLTDATIDTLQYGVDSVLDMQEMTFSSNDGAVSARITGQNTASPYKLTWLEIDTKTPSTNAAKEFYIEIDSTGSQSQHQWTITVPVTDAGTITVPLPFLFPTVTGLWVVKIGILPQDYSPTTNRILIGRMRMYQSDSRKATILPTFGGTGLDEVGAAGQVLATNSTTNGMTWISSPTTATSANLTAQSAVGNISTLTSAATSTTYDISGYLNVTAVTTDVIQVQVTYTDINSNSVTAIVPLLLQSAGTTATTASTTGQYSFSLRSIRAKLSTLITVKTVLTVSGGSIGFDAGSSITLIPNPLP